MIKYQNIPLEDWDNLIILDACRFDFFKNVYKDYLDGKLEKRISKGSNTGEWLVKTFPNKYDYLYISANPYVNSFGLPLNKCRSEYRDYSWNAIEHFSNIIDVWEFGWNEELNIIHPIEVNKAYLSNKKDMKTIIHYIQPHYPFLSYNEFNQNSRILKILKDIYLKYHFDKIFKSRRHPFIRQILSNIVNPADNLNQLERISKKIGIERLHYYYEDNLRIVLNIFSQLIEELNGTTIITADHGEAFGEEGIWEHPMETHIPVLIEVPWLEVNI
jgi:hypothetical protein